MKGIIFVELVDYVEASVGLEATDAILQGAELSTDGAYTSVGTYPVAEVARIVHGVAEHTGLTSPALYKAFGCHLFGRLAAAHPHFVGDVTDPIILLRRVEEHIHVEVRKLYPDAELPTFEYERMTTDELVMVYRSSRGLSDLCEGLIHGCFDHFGEAVSLTREELEGGASTSVRFRVTRERS